MIDATALPILSDWSRKALSQMTGVPNTGLLRLRYRQGKRDPACHKPGGRRRAGHPAQRAPAGLKPEERDADEFDRTG